MHENDDLMKNNAKLVEIFGKKVREKVKRFWRSRSRMLNSVMVNQKTVRIMFIYALLNMLVITISVNEVD